MSFVSKNKQTQEFTRYGEAKSRKAADIAGIPAGLWWENLLIFVYNSGARIGSALQIRWNWIDFENYVINQVKKPGVKTTSQIMLNEEAVQTLRTMQSISPCTNPDDHVFRWEKAKRTFYKHADKQQKFAGIPEERRFKFHGIRKYFGSEIAKRNPTAATKALGHVNPIVASRYYINGQIVALPFINAIVPIASLMEAKFTPPPIADRPIRRTIDELDYLAGSCSIMVGW
ncbi:MAG: site-specific integrase [Planctomycetaceae bacterium]|nr:site-specific integrase [Planctomycetaceae bacterium]